MKPLSVGRIPAEIGLRWLVNQPIHTMAPGMCSLEQLEQDVAAVEKQPAALSNEEQAEVERIRLEIDRYTCRICDRVCQAVCEKNLPIDMLIHHDVMYEHYRNLGLEGYLAYPMTAWARKNAEATFSRRLAALQGCTRCGRCEEVCPHGVRIMDMFDRMIDDHLRVIEAVKEQGWSDQYEEAQAPFKSKRLK
jgi:predicted aldo/keto reductase-like oxidoreductase